MIAGRASAEEEAVGRTVQTDDGADRSVSASLQSSPASPGSAASASNEIIDAVIRSGAVTRGADLRPGGLLRRGPWWWRRRTARDQAAPAGRDGSPAGTRFPSGFEAEFQEMLAQMATGEPLSIERAVPGEQRTIDDSNYYLIRLNGTEVDTGASAEARHFERFERWPDAATRSVVAPRRAHADLLRPIAEAAPCPRSVLFFDIETAGLSANTYAFLCGFMYLRGDEFHVEQAFARDYTEEEGMLRHVRETMARFDTVVTYNGASFDIPFIRNRFAVHRIPDLKPVGSVDLLHSSRRVYREILPNCRLVTVERHLRGVDRVDDIPSRFIPRAYHEYVRTRDARIMRNVVYHNRMDLFTMAVILNRLGEVALADAGVGAENPFATPPAGDTIPGPNPPQVPF